MVIDYRDLNAVTVADRYTLPRVDDCLDAVLAGGNKWWSTLDATSGFHAISLHEATQHLTTMITPSGNFSFKVLPFGLRNSPAVYQRFMNSVFAGINWKYCLIFVDDCCVFSRTFDEHISALASVFARARAGGVFFSPTKAHFVKKEVEFLGMVLTREGLKPQTRIIEKLKALPIPRSKREIQSFMGLAQFVARFIPSYAQRCKGLRSLLRLKHTRYTDEEISKANVEVEVADVVKSLTSYPVLRHIDYDLPFVLKVDGSVQPWALCEPLPTSGRKAPPY